MPAILQCLYLYANTYYTIVDVSARTGGEQILTEAL